MLTAASPSTQSSTLALANTVALDHAVSVDIEGVPGSFDRVNVSFLQINPSSVTVQVSPSAMANKASRLNNVPITDFSPDIQAAIGALWDLMKPYIKAQF